MEGSDGPHQDPRGENQRVEELERTVHPHVQGQHDQHRKHLPHRRQLRRQVLAERSRNQTHQEDQAGSQAVRRVQNICVQ